MYFTRQVEEILKADPSSAQASLKALKERLLQQLSAYTSHDLSNELLLQLKVKALVLDLIHNVDVIDQLIEFGTTQLGEWQWQKQLRFYINSKGKCAVRMCDAEVRYRATCVVLVCRCAGVSCRL